MLEILHDLTVEFDVIEYIKTPLSEDTLRGLLQLVGCEPTEMLHPGAFGKLNRELDDFNTPDALIGLLMEHPEVMNRPICVRGERAVIARPAELVHEILD